MPRVSTWIKSAVVLLAFAVWFALPPRSEAQSKLFTVIDTQISTAGLQQEQSLKEALQLILVRAKEATKKNSEEIPILVDYESFRAETPDAYPTADAFYETKVKFPPYPSRMTVANALRITLGHLPSKNGTYIVMPDHILITTYQCTGPEKKLQEKVRGVFEERPLHLALRELSESVGTSIIIDNRAKEKAKTTVSATFLNDIDLAGALRVLTEMADLKVIVLDGAIFVTTAEHVATLRKEHAEKRGMVPGNPTATSPVSGGVGGGIGGIGGVGGSGVSGGGLGGGFPGGGMPGFPTFVDPPIDPFWPYTPRVGSGAAQ